MSTPPAVSGSIFNSGPGAARVAQLKAQDKLDVNQPVGPLLPELDPATRYIEMDPGVANAEDSGMADELRGADIVILSSIRDDWNEPNESDDFGPAEPNEVIAEHFCLVESFGTGLYGRGLYEVYVPCEDGAPR